MTNNFSHLNNEEVKIISDSKNVLTILQFGSRKHLHNIAEDILNTCSENDIQINPIWKPRNENKKADTLSRLTDMDDWSKDDEIFEHFEKMWGVHTVDRFATHYNKKCVRFNSKYWCPNTECVDVLNACWNGENNWLVPPPNLVTKAINKLVADKAKEL